MFQAVRPLLSIYFKTTITRARASSSPSSPSSFKRVSSALLSPICRIHHAISANFFWAKAGQKDLAAPARVLSKAKPTSKRTIKVERNMSKSIQRPRHEFKGESKLTEWKNKQPHTGGNLAEICPSSQPTQVAVRIALFDREKGCGLVA